MLAGDLDNDSDIDVVFLNALNSINIYFNLLYIGPPDLEDELDPKDELIQRLLTIDPWACPTCREGRLYRVSELPPALKLSPNPPPILDSS